MTLPLSSGQALILSEPALSGQILIEPGQIDWARAALSRMIDDRRSAATKRAYKGDLDKFFGWRADVTSPKAVTDLCSLNAGALAVVLNGYAASMIADGLREATVNRRLSSIRSLLRMCRKYGAGNPDPSGLVDSEKVIPYRDTRGPALSDVVRILSAPDQSTPSGLRDYAMLRLLWGNALRRAELVACNVGDFSASQGRLAIIGKGGGTQKIPVTLKPKAVEAVQAYLRTRSPDPRQLPESAPLFCTMARSVKAEGRTARLTADGVYYLLSKRYGAALDLKLRPHAMRHAAITAHINATGDLAGAQSLGRHKNANTTKKYDDNSRDRQGKASEVLEALA